MGFAKFLLELLDILAWPAVALVILFTLRAPLIQLIPLATKLKYRDLELEFGRGLQKAAAGADAAFPQEQDGKSRILRSVTISPRTAVLDAWREIHSAAQEAILAAEPDFVADEKTPLRQIGEKLVASGLLNDKQGQLYHDLRLLRNKVAHAAGFEINSSDAMQFVELCFRLIGQIEAATGTEQPASD